MDNNYKKFFTTFFLFINEQSFTRRSMPWMNTKYRRVEKLFFHTSLFFLFLFSKFRASILILDLIISSEGISVFIFFVVLFENIIFFNK